MCFIRSLQCLNKSELEQIGLEIAKGTGNPKPVFIKLFRNITEDPDNLQYNNILSRIRRDQFSQSPLKNPIDNNIIACGDSNDMKTLSLSNDDNSSLFFDDRLQEAIEIEGHNID